MLTAGEADALLREARLVVAHCVGRLRPRGRRSVIGAVAGHLREARRHEEFHGLRPYALGDSARAVRWRESALQGRTVVAEFRRPVQPTVVIDMIRVASPCEGERVRRFLARLAWVLARSLALAGARVVVDFGTRFVVRDSRRVGQLRASLVSYLGGACYMGGRSEGSARRKRGLHGAHVIAIAPACIPLQDLERLLLTSRGTWAADQSVVYGFPEDFAAAGARTRYSASGATLGSRVVPTAEQWAAQMRALAVAGGGGQRAVSAIWVTRPEEAADQVAQRVLLT